MGQPTEKKATYTDLYDIPENMIGEIIDGELHTMPRPSPRHAKITSELGAEIIYPYLWLINPIDKTLDVFKMVSGGWMLSGSFVENDKAGAEPFQEIEIDLAELWFE